MSFPFSSFANPRVYRRPSFYGRWVGPRVTKQPRKINPRRMRPLGKRADFTMRLRCAEWDRQFAKQIVEWAARADEFLGTRA